MHSRYKPLYLGILHNIKGGWGGAFDRTMWMVSYNHNLCFVSSSINWCHSKITLSWWGLCLPWIPAYKKCELLFLNGYHTAHISLPKMKKHLCNKIDYWRVYFLLSSIFSDCLMQPLRNGTGFLLMHQGICAAMPVWEGYT